MKINKLFFAGIAAIGLLASCVNEEEVSQGTSSKDSVRVSLQLATGSASTRTTGDLPTNTDVTGDDAKESKINRICVGVFDGSNNTVTIKEISPTTSSTDGKITVDFNTTTDANKVIIAANAPEGWFKNIKTEADFIATVKAADLAYTTSSDGKSNTDRNTTKGQLSTALPMYSAETTLKNTNNTLKTTDDASIALTRMVARVAITSITMNFDAGLYAGASFTQGRRSIISTEKTFFNFNLTF